jgi:hypothetical protein
VEDNHNMTTTAIRDRCWLWGMKVNVLQESADYDSLFLPPSSMTVEDAIQRTGITNVIIAGHLPISRESLQAVPSATRIICKWSLHQRDGDRQVPAVEACRERLMAAKELAADDRRIEGFLVDDFSTGSLDAGIGAAHLARFQFANAVHPPQLPLLASVYTLSLGRAELPPTLPFFAQYVVPLWHAGRIDDVPADLERLAALGGGKPVLFTLYVFDFGDQKPIPRELMQRHLDMAERLLAQERIAGLVILGTCMMDLDWEANHCFYDWLERVGDRAL